MKGFGAATGPSGGRGSCGWNTAEGGPSPSQPPTPGAAHPVRFCVPRDRSGTRLSTGWGTAGRASATSSSVSDHLPAGSPRPPSPCPRTCPRRPHTCPRTRALPSLPRGDPGALAACSHLPPRTHPPRGTAMGTSHSGAGTSVGVNKSPQSWCLPGAGGCVTSALQFVCSRCLCDPLRTTSFWYLMWSQVFLRSQCPQGSGADVTVVLACSHATSLVLMSPQYVTWCPYCPGALCHLGTTVLQVLVPPCCLYNPSTSTTSVHGPSDPSAPLSPCHPRVPCASPAHQ